MTRHYIQRTLKITQKQLELEMINEFQKVSGHKINTPKSPAGLDTSDELSGRAAEKTPSAAQASVFPAQCGRETSPARTLPHVHCRRVTAAGAWGLRPPAPAARCPPGPRRPWLAVLGRRPTLPGHGFAEAAARVVKASDVAWLRGAQGVLHVGSWKTEQEVGDPGCRQCGHCHCRTFRPDRLQPRESAGAPPLADSPAPRPPRHAR